MGKLSVVAAFAVGYVAGARAGRERYEEIVALASRLMSHRPGTSASQRLRDARGRFVSAKAGS
jgi:hypothetical protein